VNLTLATGILEDVIEHAKKSFPSEGLGCWWAAGRRPLVPVTTWPPPRRKQYEMNPGS